MKSHAAQDVFVFLIVLVGVSFGVWVSRWKRSRRDATRDETPIARPTWGTSDRLERTAVVLLGVLWAVIAVALVTNRPGQVAWSFGAVAAFLAGRLLLSWVKRRHALKGL